MCFWNFEDFFLLINWFFKVFIIKNRLKIDFGVKPHPSIIIFLPLLWLLNSGHQITRHLFFFIQKRVNDMFEKKKKAQAHQNFKSAQLNFF